MNESDFQSVAGGRYSCACSRVSTSNHDKVITVFGGWDGGKFESFSTKFKKSLACGRGNVFGIFGKVESITSPIESGKVYKLKGCFL